MDRLEIAVRLLIEHPQNCEEWAFRRADKILAYHEETKPKREITGMDLAEGKDESHYSIHRNGRIEEITKTEYNLRNKHSENTEALRVIDMMKEALTDEEFANWVRNRPRFNKIFDLAHQCLGHADCSFFWKESLEGHEYWDIVCRRLHEESK